MCFVWISEQTAIISLYNINCLSSTRQGLCSALLCSALLYKQFRYARVIKSRTVAETTDIWQEGPCWMSAQFMWDLWLTEWNWDSFVVDRVALRQVCVWQSGTGTGLCLTEWHWDRFMFDRVALGQVCGWQSGTGTGLYVTEWHWDRFVGDRVALGKVCGWQSGTGRGFFSNSCFLC